MYSNVFGYLGGVSWAILVARVCQLWPNGPPGVLVHRFFKFMHMWPWPSPIMLTSVVGPTNVRPGLDSSVWNPLANVRDQLDLLPILTPAYPRMNSTYNVSPTTKRVLMHEFKRGMELLDAMQKRPLSESGHTVWLDALVDVDFFLQYRDYLAVHAFAGSTPEFDLWFGWVESKMRHFITGLSSSHVDVHPWPVAFRSCTPHRPSCATFYIGLDLSLPSSGEKKATFDFTPVVAAFKAMTMTPSFVPFSNSMQVDVTHVRAYDLPDDVFIDARRPKPRKRSPVPETTPTSPNKRHKVNNDQ